MPNITFYFSLLSPWSYFGFAELLRISNENNLSIDYKPAQILEIFDSMGGVRMPKRHPSRLEYRGFELKRWAKRRNLNINLKPDFFPFDVSLADCVVLAILANNQNPKQYILNAYEAIWIHNKNLADEAVIVEILHACELDAQMLINAAKSPKITQKYAQNTHNMVEDNAFGMPFYIYNNEPFWGQDRLDFLEDAIKNSTN